MTTSPHRITESHIITSSNRHAHVLSRARTPIWTQCWKPCSDGLMPWMRHGWRVDGLTGWRVDGLTGWRHGGHMWAQHLDSMASPGVVASTTCGADDSPGWVIGLQELNQWLNQRDGDRKMHDDKWTKWRNQWGISEESVRNQVIFWSSEFQATYRVVTEVGDQGRIGVATLSENGNHVNTFCLYLFHLLFLQSYAYNSVVHGRSWHSEIFVK